MCEYLQSFLPASAAQHAHAVRPLRARDHWHFSAFVCGALAAADAQDVGPPLRNALFCCSSRAWRQRARLYRVRNAVVHAHPVETPSRHALSCTQRHRACPSNHSAVAACSIVCAASSRMPIQSERHRAMLYHACNVVAWRDGWPNNRM